MCDRRFLSCAETLPFGARWTKSQLYAKVPNSGNRSYLIGSKTTVRSCVLYVDQRSDREKRQAFSNGEWEVEEEAEKYLRTSLHITCILSFRSRDIFIHSGSENLLRKASFDEPTKCRFVRSDPDGCESFESPAFWSGSTPRSSRAGHRILQQVMVVSRFFISLPVLPSSSSLPLSSYCCEVVCLLLQTSVRD